MRNTRKLSDVVQSKFILTGPLRKVVRNRSQVMCFVYYAADEAAGGAQ